MNVNTPKLSMYRIMIKVLWLMFNPVRAWEGIVRARRNVAFILLIYLLPLLVITSAFEGYGLSRWGKAQGAVAHTRVFSRGEAIVYEGIQILLSLIVVFVGATLVKLVGETFHGRHNFRQTFTVVAYGLGPVFLWRLLDAFEKVSPWWPWIVGILFTFTVLYHGVPRVMDPDPPQAFGLFVMTGVLLLLVSGLARFLTAWYIQGRFTKIEPFISGLGARLPF